MPNGFDLKHVQLTTGGSVAFLLKARGLVNIWLPVAAPKPLHMMCQKRGGMVRTGRENVAWRQHPKYPSWIFMSWDKQGAYPRQQNYQNCCTVYTFNDLEGDFL